LNYLIRLLKIMAEEAHIANQISKAFPNTTLYEIFEVTEDASSEDIKKAYRKKALVHHPDKGGKATME